jgi:hypothetical protein
VRLPADRVVEEEGVLCHVGHLRGEHARREVAQVAAVDADAAVLRVPQPSQQQRDRGLPRPGRADDRQRPAGRHLEVDVAEHGDVGFVPKPMPSASREAGPCELRRTGPWVIASSSARTCSTRRQPATLLAVSHIRYPSMRTGTARSDNR